MVRQGLAQLYTWEELGRFNGLRLKAVKAAGGDIPGMPNISKLSMSHIMRLTRDLGLRIVGRPGDAPRLRPEGPGCLDEATGNPLVAVVTEHGAVSPRRPPSTGAPTRSSATSSASGSSGFRRSPTTTATTPFSELPKNV